MCCACLLHHTLCSWLPPRRGFCHLWFGSSRTRAQTHRRWPGTWGPFPVAKLHLAPLARGMGARPAPFSARSSSPSPTSLALVRTRGLKLPPQPVKGVGPMPRGITLSSPGARVSPTPAQQGRLQGPTPWPPNDACGPFHPQWPSLGPTLCPCIEGCLGPPHLK